MLEEIFYWIFNMSITATITGAIVMLCRAVFKMPKRVSVLLWCIPFFRMVIPIGLQSKYSLMTLLARITTKTIVVYQPTETVSASAMNHVAAADSYFPITYKEARLGDVFGTASIVWIVVSAAILLMLVVLYGTTLGEMKDAEHLRDRIYFSGKVISPGVYGIIMPKIVLPESYRNREIDYILLHEEAHIRRGDNIWRIVAFLIVAIHWFNPFSWIFLKSFLADVECACDESVLKKLTENEAREYAGALLDSCETANMFISPFGGAKIRTRIENILSFRKMTWISALVSSVLVTAIFYILLTNAG